MGNENHRRCRKDEARRCRRERARRCGKVKSEAGDKGCTTCQGWSLRREERMIVEQSKIRETFGRHGYVTIVFIDRLCADESEDGSSGSEA